MPSVPSGLPKRLHQSRSNPTQLPLHPCNLTASFRHKHTRSLSLICRIEVDNILTFGSNVSLCNGRVYPLLPPPRPPFSRRRLCICGGSFHISDDTAQVVILSMWSKRSLTIRCLLFSQKYQPILINLQNVYNFFSVAFEIYLRQPRAKMARSTGRKQKRPVLTHTDHGKHQKANGARSLKNVPRLCISTSLNARFDKRMQPHSMPV